MVPVVFSVDRLFVCMCARVRGCVCCVGRCLSSSQVCAWSCRAARPPVPLRLSPPLPAALASFPSSSPLSSPRPLLMSYALTAWGTEAHDAAPVPAHKSHRCCNACQTHTHAQHNTREMQAAAQWGWTERTTVPAAAAALSAHPSATHRLRCADLTRSMLCGSISHTLSVSPLTPSLPPCLPALCVRQIFALCTACAS